MLDTYSTIELEAIRYTIYRQYTILSVLVTCACIKPFLKLWTCNYSLELSSFKDSLPLSWTCAWGLDLYHSSPAGAGSNRRCLSTRKFLMPYISAHVTAACAGLLSATFNITVTWAKRCTLEGLRRPCTNRSKWNDGRCVCPNVKIFIVYAVSV